MQTVINISSHAAILYIVNHTKSNWIPLFYLSIICWDICWEYLSLSFRFGICMSSFSSSYLCLLKRRILYLLSWILYKASFKTYNLNEIDHIKYPSNFEKLQFKQNSLNSHTFIFLSLDLLSWHQAKQVMVSCLSNDSSTSLAVKNISIFTKSFKKKKESRSCLIVLIL